MTYVIFRKTTERSSVHPPSIHPISSAKLPYPRDYTTP